MIWGETQCYETDIEVRQLFHGNTSLKNIVPCIRRAGHGGEI